MVANKQSSRRGGQRLKTFAINLTSESKRYTCIYIFPDLDPFSMKISLFINIYNIYVYYIPSPIFTEGLRADLLCLDESSIALG